MDELKELLYCQFERVGKPVNWVRFFRSNLAAIKQVTVKEREDFIREFIQEIDCFSLAADICDVSVDFVREMLHQWDDNDLFYSLSPKNYLQFAPNAKRNWGGMSYFAAADMDERLIKRYKENIDWKYCLQNRHFSGDFIDRNIDFFMWIDKNNNNFQLWNTISFYQPNLSDQFIDRFADQLDWELMSANQDLSEYIMLKYFNRINWEAVLSNKNIYLSYTVERKLREKGIL